MANINTSKARRPWWFFRQRGSQRCACTTVRTVSSSAMTVLLLVRKSMLCPCHHWNSHSSSAMTVLPPVRKLTLCLQHRRNSHSSSAMTVLLLVRKSMLCLQHRRNSHSSSAKTVLPPVRKLMLTSGFFAQSADALQRGQVLMRVLFSVCRRIRFRREIRSCAVANPGPAPVEGQQTNLWSHLYMLPRRTRTCWGTSGAPNWRTGLRLEGSWIGPCSEHLDWLFECAYSCEIYSAQEMPRWCCGDAIPW